MNVYEPFQWYLHLRSALTHTNSLVQYSMAHEGHRNKVGRQDDSWHNLFRFRRPEINPTENLRLIVKSSTSTYRFLRQKTIDNRRQNVSRIE